MLSTPPHTRDHALWATEVARVLETASTLAPAARQLVVDVLAALLADPATDPSCRRDAQTLLDAFNRPALAAA
jgi:hypothetical protein